MMKDNIEEDILDDFDDEDEVTDEIELISEDNKDDNSINTVEAKGEISEEETSEDQEADVGTKKVDKKIKKNTGKNSKKIKDEVEATDKIELYIDRIDREKAEKIKQQREDDEKNVSDDNDAITKELDAFIAKGVPNISVEPLSIRDSIPFWINTKSLVLNWIISNDFNKGLPGTRAIMISGESGKGKSLLLDSFLGENVKMGGASYKFDIEDAGTQDFTAKIVGSEKVAGKIRTITPSNITKETKEKNRVITIERLNVVLNKIIDWQISASSKKGKKLKSVLVGIDSVSQLSSQKEIEDNLKEKGKKDLTSTQKIREMFRVITQQQKFANMTLIGLAQLTANIGVMFGPSKVENAKGSGFKYASSLNLQATTDKELSNSIKGGADIPIGIKMRFKTTKNRIEFKGRDAWVYFYFQGGMDRYGGLIELLSQYGVFTASSKPTVYGEYSETTTFEWVHPDTGEVFKFGFTENKKGRISFPKYIQSLEEDEREYLLKIWNYQLNEIYENQTKDWEESILLESDDPEELDVLLEDGEE